MGKDKIKSNLPVINTSFVNRPEAPTTRAHLDLHDNKNL